MKNISHYLKSLGVLLLGIILIILVAFVIVYAGIYWNFESWPVMVSILIGAGLFFFIKKSFREFRKIK